MLVSTSLGYWLILGLYLTLRGYHSLDGDQAYRLPLLLHAQDPAAIRPRPVRQSLRCVQSAPRLPAASGLGDRSSGSLRRAARPLRRDVPGDLPGNRPAGAGRLAGMGGFRRLGGCGPGPDGQGGEHRDQSSLRGDGSGPPHGHGGGVVGAGGRGRPAGARLVAGGGRPGAGRFHSSLPGATTGDDRRRIVDRLGSGRGPEPRFLALGGARSRGRPGWRCCRDWR